MSNGPGEWLPESQRKVHATAEAFALVTAPISIALGLSATGLHPAARAFLVTLGIATIAVDGALLARRARNDSDPIPAHILKRRAIRARLRR